MNLENVLNSEALCKECGLCCQDVFHTYVSLSNDEVCIIEKTNINVQFNKEKKISFFTLPCPAFNGHCTIYQKRPSVCSKYQCDLLKSIIREEISLKDALKIVNKIKSHLGELLPELHAFSHKDKGNNPPHLMKMIFDNLEEDQTKEQFKKENKKLMMNFAIYNLLKDKYFYKKENTR